MTWLLHGSGLVALVIVCAVLFIEECGVPLPMLPGDGLLVLGGMLVASGRVPALVFVAAATSAMVLGALIGHAWSSAIGGKALARLADRFGATRHFEAARGRLLGAGPKGIMMCRLIPGVRVYTNLAAGAAGMARRTFVAGVIPSVLAWVIGFGAVGVVAGRPVERFLITSGNDLLLGGLLVGLVVVTLVLARHLPARPTGRVSRAGSPWRLAAAVILDVSVVAVVGSIGAGVVQVALHTGGSHSALGLALSLAGGAVVYVLASRRAAGSTAGEGLLQVTYRRRLAA